MTGAPRIVDVGGDDRGAYALGRLSPAIRAENNYDMFLVINKYRPLTPDAESTLEIMHEIESAASLPFTGIINNSNLAAETTPETVLNSVSYAEEVSRLSGLPLVLTSAEESVAESWKGKSTTFFRCTCRNGRSNKTVGTVPGVLSGASKNRGGYYGKIDVPNR